MLCFVVLLFFCRSFFCFWFWFCFCLLKLLVCLIECPCLWPGFFPPEHCVHIVAQNKNGPVRCTFALLGLALALPVPIPLGRPNCPRKHRVRALLFSPVLHKLTFVYVCVCVCVCLDWDWDWDCVLAIPLVGWLVGWWLDLLLWNDVHACMHACMQLRSVKDMEVRVPATVEFWVEPLYLAMRNTQVCGHCQSLLAALPCLALPVYRKSCLVYLRPFPQNVLGLSSPCRPLNWPAR